jgi:hypothetical protein
MSILSCGKSEKHDFTKSLDVLAEGERYFIYEKNLLESAPYYGLWKVRLANGNVIGKVKSIDKDYSENAMDKAYLGIPSEDNYDIIIINVKDNTYKTIITDKYLNIILLPVLNGRTIKTNTETPYEYMFSFQEGKTYPPFFKCFIIQTIELNKTFKLIYLDNIDHSIDNVIQKHYEYESTYPPYKAEITITPHYFIVYHPEEYILINQQTGEYKIIDSARANDIDW